MLSLFFLSFCAILYPVSGSWPFHSTEIVFVLFLRVSNTTESQEVITIQRELCLGQTLLLYGSVR
jgi:hypothetical protein